MFALTIRQPWAELIASGLKTLEHRRRRTHHRGPLLIHAARAVPWLRQHRDLPRGMIVAQVDLIDCIQIGRLEFVYVLQNARRVEPVPMLGRQGFWHVGNGSGTGTGKLLIQKVPNSVPVPEKCFGSVPTCTQT
jgi:hypothetical protein